MKKIAAILLTSILIFAFCACGSDEEKTQKTDENQAYLESLNIEKVDNFLYSCEYEDYDYDTISQEFEKNYKSGGCATVRNGNFIGHNFDWKNDKEAYFVIKTPAGNGRYGAIGMAGAVSALTSKTVDSGKWNDAYKSLPFVTLDGINDQGLVCTALTVPADAEGLAAGTNPEGEDLCAIMLTRYVLDNASNVDEALKLLKQRNIYMPDSEQAKQAFHWMLADEGQTVLIECVDNEMKVIEDESIVTNFYMTNFDKAEQTLPEMPIGIERYNILKDNYDTANTAEGMVALMKSVWYTGKYNTDMVPFWYSEYSKDYGEQSYGKLDSSNYGDPDLSGDQFWKAGEYKQCVMDQISQYREETISEKNKRDGGTQKTCYTSVYDMQNLKLTVLPQEKDSSYNYKLKK